MPRRLTVAALALSAFACKGEHAKPWVDDREPCADHDPRRNLYWGDLHVHTAYSFDAYVNEVRVDPEDAYRFAKGESVELPMGPLTIDRPLDFAAVTDHAEYLAEVSACIDPDSAAWDAPLCQGLRDGTNAALVQFGLGLNGEDPSRFSDICDEVDCTALAGDVWGKTLAAAEAAYDRTEACTFTSLVAYEWSGARELSNLHRNVIFRSSRVPALPISHFEEPTARGLWTALDRQCIDGETGIDGCDVLAIPHNTNWSNGNLFHVEYAQGQDEAEASLRARLEPLIEIFQHKGDSECRNGLSGILGEPDEQCAFEKLRPDPVTDCGDTTGAQGMILQGCLSRLDFVRGILLEGLREQERIGVNPYKLGIIASTDTHNGTPGAVSESAYVGHFGAREGTPEARLTGAVPGGPQNSPGGLTAVWAEENSREAIFDALRRRETYGTSGPRMAVRFFGAWDLPADLCERGDLVDVADEAGVPMGGQLPAPPDGAGAPAFVVSALKDPGGPGAPGTDLQRVQIIKGWLDAAGQAHVEVFDVAGSDTGAGVDESTCAPTGTGAQNLCAVWRDPDYQAGRPTYYYARVLENPSCRWSTRDCNTIPEPDQPAECSDPDRPKVIQERAWTSPIWSPS